MPDLFALTRPFLHRLPAETAHQLALRALAAGIVPRQPPVRDPVLATALFDRALPHPVGLAAGFDKNGLVFERMYAQGFSFVEVGGVTPRPQRGNPRPRMFRLPVDRALINRAGFPNDGAERIAARIAAGRRADRVLGINLASNTDSDDPASDFVALIRRFAPLADFLTLDISCPNTANGRLFLRPGPLDELLRRVAGVFAAPAAPPRPAFAAKLAPDLDDATLATVVDRLTAFGIDGIIISNTTAERPPALVDPRRAESGGLSGAPLFARSTALLRRVYAITDGRIPLIGVGGIGSGRDAYAKIRAGAAAVQVYTAFIYDGPALITRIASELAAHLRADGFTSVGAAVGADHGTAGGTAARPERQIADHAAPQARPHGFDAPTAST